MIPSQVRKGLDFRLLNEAKEKIRREQQQQQSESSQKQEGHNDRTTGDQNTAIFRSKLASSIQAMLTPQHQKSTDIWHHYIYRFDLDLTADENGKVSAGISGRMVPDLIRKKQKEGDEKVIENICLRIRQRRETVPKEEEENEPLQLPNIPATFPLHQHEDNVEDEEEDIFGDAGRDYTCDMTKRKTMPQQTYFENKEAEPEPERRPVSLSDMISHVTKSSQPTPEVHEKPTQRVSEDETSAFEQEKTKTLYELAEDTDGEPEDSYAPLPVAAKRKSRWDDEDDIDAMMDVALDPVLLGKEDKKGARSMKRKLGAELDKVDREMKRQFGEGFKDKKEKK